jgi:hypothetical protein
MKVRVLVKKNWISERHGTTEKDLFVEKKGKEDMVLTDVQPCLQMENKNQLIISQAKFDVLVL